MKTKKIKKLYKKYYIDKYGKTPNMDCLDGKKETILTNIWDEAQRDLLKELIPFNEKNKWNEVYNLMVQKLEELD